MSTNHDDASRYAEDFDSLKGKAIRAAITVFVFFVSAIMVVLPALSR